MAGFELIIAVCDRAGKTGYGEEYRKTFPSLPEVHAIASNPFIKRIGRCVIIRPNFNEDGYFREWRSFNGGPWEECRWEA